MLPSDMALAGSTVLGADGKGKPLDLTLVTASALGQSTRSSFSISDEHTTQLGARA